MEQRLEALCAWVRDALRAEAISIQRASSDASFRRYFRVTIDDTSYIVMDAPPEKEDATRFIDIAQRLRQVGVNVPRVLAHDREQGFLLLTDLGTELYLSRLAPNNADRLYSDAIDALVTMQLRTDVRRLPAYDEDLLHREMALFPKWLLGEHLEMPLDQGRMLDDVFALLVDSALAQPRSFVHRDYHSRNLLYCSTNNPGILDFQDAVVGPVTYDLVSLLRDCYVKWPQGRVMDWLMSYLSKAQAADLLAGIDSRAFKRQFDFMGLQRHLKASGIFARLFHRDGKPGYLKDIPRTLSYVVDVCRCYPELAMFGRFVAGHVLPRCETIQHQGHRDGC